MQWYWFTGFSWSSRCYFISQMQGNNTSRWADVHTRRLLGRNFHSVLGLAQPVPPRKPHPLYIPWCWFFLLATKTGRKEKGGKTSFVHQSALGCQGSTMIINHRVTKRGLFRVVHGDSTLRRSLMRQRQVEQQKTLLYWLCNQGKAAPLSFHPRAEMTAFRATDGNKLWNGYVMTVTVGGTSPWVSPKLCRCWSVIIQVLMSSAVLSSSTNVSLIRRCRGTGPAVMPR